MSHNLSKNKSRQESPSPRDQSASISVALFASCIVDASLPSIGFASAKLLSDAGCNVSVPQLQTCCGQAAYNNGVSDDARDMAKQLIEQFESYDFTVVPSGSCAAMIKLHYVRLLADDPAWLLRAQNLRAKCYELTSFLTEVLHLKTDVLALTGEITYHDACSGLRELNIKQQPRKLLTDAGLNIKELEDTQACCGFGGSFCVKYPDISTQLADSKIEQALATQAKVLVSGEPGCLLHLQARLEYLNSPLKAMHIAEVLTGMDVKEDAQVKS